MERDPFGKFIGKKEIIEIEASKLKTRFRHQPFLGTFWGFIAKKKALFFTEIGQQFLKVDIKDLNPNIIYKKGSIYRLYSLYSKKRKDKEIKVSFIKGEGFYNSPIIVGNFLRRTRRYNLEEIKKGVCFLTGKNLSEDFIRFRKKKEKIAWPKSIECVQNLPRLLAQIGAPSKLSFEIRKLINSNICAEAIIEAKMFETSYLYGVILRKNSDGYIINLGGNIRAFIPLKEISRWDFGLEYASETKYLKGSRGLGTDSVNYIYTRGSLIPLQIIDFHFKDSVGIGVSRAGALRGIDKLFVLGPNIINGLKKKPKDRSQIETKAIESFPSKERPSLIRNLNFIKKEIGFEFENLEVNPAVSFKLRIFPDLDWESKGILKEFPRYKSWEIALYLGVIDIYIKKLIPYIYHPWSWVSKSKLRKELDSGILNNLVIKGVWKLLSLEAEKEKKNTIKGEDPYSKCLNIEPETGINFNYSMLREGKLTYSKKHKLNISENINHSWLKYHKSLAKLAKKENINFWELKESYKKGLLFNLFRDPEFGGFNFEFKDTVDFSLYKINLNYFQKKKNLGSFPPLFKNITLSEAEEGFFQKDIDNLLNIGWLFAKNFSARRAWGKPSSPLEVSLIQVLNLLGFNDYFTSKGFRLFRYPSLDIEEYRIYLLEINRYMFKAKVEKEEPSLDLQSQFIISHFLLACYKVLERRRLSLSWNYFCRELILKAQKTTPPKASREKIKFLRTEAKLYKKIIFGKIGYKECLTLMKKKERKKKQEAFFKKERSEKVFCKAVPDSSYNLSKNYKPFIKKRCQDLLKKYIKTPLNYEPIISTKKVVPKWPFYSPTHSFPNNMEEIFYPKHQKGGDAPI